MNEDTFALATVNRTVLEFNRDGILATVDCSLEISGIADDLTHSIPDSIVLGTTSKEATDVCERKSEGQNRKDKTAGWISRDGRGR